MMKHDLSMKNGGKLRLLKLFAEDYKCFFLKAEEVKVCIVYWIRVTWVILVCLILLALLEDKCISVYLKLPWIGNVSSNFEKHIYKAIASCSMLKNCVDYNTRVTLPCAKEVSVPTTQKVV